MVHRALSNKTYLSLGLLSLLKLRFQFIMFPDLVDDVHYDVYVDFTTLKKGWRGDPIRQLIGMNTVT